MTLNAQCQVKDMYIQIKKANMQAKKDRSPKAAAYTIILGELARLKGTKDKWTKTLQTGSPSDEVVKKVLGELRKGELDRIDMGGTPDVPFMEVLDELAPVQVQISDDVVEEWLTENVDFGKLKSPMQAMGMLKKKFGEALNGKAAQAVILQLNSRG